MSSENVLRQSGLLFLVKVKNDGKEEDGITVIRRPYISIESCMGNLMPVEVEKISGVLSQHNITYKFLPRTFERDASISIEVPDMFLVIRLLEEAGWQIKDHVPFFVWQVICESLNIKKIPFSVLEEKIGSDIWQNLHPYQKIAVQKAAQWQRCYIGDFCGLGKTLESLVSCYYFRDRWPALVVCPSSLRYTWRSEITRWLPVEEKRVFIVKATKDLKKLEKNPHDFLVISYNLLPRPDVMKTLVGKYDVVVLDESHYIKSQGSKRSQAAVHMASKASIRILLSGTPFNYPVEMFQQIKVINPKIFPWFFNGSLDTATDEVGKYYYAKRYCKPHQIRFNNREQWVFKGFENHEELNAVLNTFMIRRKTEEALPQLPDKNRICITLDPLTTKQEKQIAELLKAEKKARQQKTSDEKSSQVNVQSVKQGSAEKFMESFRLVCTFKIPHVINFIQDHLLDDLMTENKHMKALIFFHHDAMREALETCMMEKDYKYFVINGATPAAKRFEYTEAFQKTNKYRIGLLSITAASTGLTLTAANTVVFTEILFGPDQHLQAEARSSRLGQKNTVNIFYLLEPKTTDDINFGLIKKKERESTLMLDGKSSHIESQRMTTPEEGTSLSSLMMAPPQKKKRPPPNVELDEQPQTKRMVIKRPPKVEIQVMPALTMDNLL